MREIRVGSSLTETARLMGCARETARKALVAAGLPVPQGHRGPPRRETCKHGHSLADAVIRRRLPHETEKAHLSRQCRTCKKLARPAERARARERRA